MATRKMSAEDRRREREYRVSNAVSTLTSAENIKKDASLMRDVRKHVASLSKSVGVSKGPAKKGKK